jgi:small-conductance mechanosensitive channel
MNDTNISSELPNIIPAQTPVLLVSLGGLMGVVIGLVLGLVAGAGAGWVALLAEKQPNANPRN